MSDTADSITSVTTVTPRKLSPFKRFSSKLMSNFKNIFDSSAAETIDLAPGSVDVAHDSRERKSHSSHSKKSGPTELAAQLSGMELENSEDMKVPRCLLHPQRPSDQGKLTVVLDMDETLIHTEFTGKPHLDYRQAEDRLTVSGRRQPDFSVVLYENDPNQQPEVVHVYKRPGLDAFLAKLSEICEPVIFTASLPMYARPILKAVDPKRRCKSRLYRNATTKYMGYPHVKCLSHIGRDLTRTILVDNSPFAMCADPDNAIPIKSYYDDPEARELEYLFEIIKEMVILNLEDVRPHLRRKFNFGAVLSSIMPAPVSPVSNVPQ